MEDTLLFNVFINTPELMTTILLFFLFPIFGSFSFSFGLFSFGVTVPSFGVASVLDFGCPKRHVVSSCFHFHNNI